MKNGAKPTKIQMPDYLTLFDEQFSIDDFRSAVDESGKESDHIVSEIRDAIHKASAKQPDGEYRMVVQMDEATQKGIEAGKIHLVKTKNGDLLAQIRREDGKLGERLSIKEEMEEKGISQEEIDQALQIEAIKDQLMTMIESMKNVENQVTAIRQGQQNDRIGLFYSGLSLFSEARNLKDESLRKQVYAQSLKSFSDANSQMVQEMRESISYLANGRYKNDKNQIAKINTHLSTIHQCFDVVYRASFLKAAIYQQAGEIPSMLSVLDEYGRFVEKMVVPYVGMLSELDQNSQFVEAGCWGQIARTLDGCKDLKKRISSGEIYYISQGEAENAE